MTQQKKIRLVCAWPGPHDVALKELGVTRHDDGLQVAVTSFEDALRVEVTLYDAGLDVDVT